MVSRPLLSLPHILNDCCLSDLHPLLNKVPVLSVRLCLFELSDVLTGWQQLRDIFCCHFHPLCCKDRGVGRRARGDLCDPSVSPPTFRDSHCCCLSVCHHQQVNTDVCLFNMSYILIQCVQEKNKGSEGYCGGNNPTCQWHHLSCRWRHTLPFTGFAAFVMSALSWKWWKQHWQNEFDLSVWKKTINEFSPTLGLEMNTCVVQFVLLLFNSQETKQHIVVDLLCRHLQIYWSWHHPPTSGEMCSCLFPLEGSMVAGRKCWLTVRKACSRDWTSILTLLITPFNDQVPLNNYRKLTTKMNHYQEQSRK